jgi:hypothetical protein
MLAALLVAPHRWSPADALALAVHAAVVPAAIGATLGVIAGRLSGRGRSALVVAAVLLATAAVAADLRPAPPRAPISLHGPEVASASVSVLVIAVDGAEWDVLQPLIDAGEAPRLAALQTAGVSFRLRSLPVPASPVVWTTVATGKGPEEHGIEGFLSTTLRFESPFRRAAMGAPSPRLRCLLHLIPGAGTEELPVTALDRRTTAIWNQASAAGRTVVTVGWWGTWPAEPVFGVQVSDHVSYQRLNASASAREIEYGQVTPAARYPQVKEAVVAPVDVATPLGPGIGVEHDPVSEVRVALAAMETYGGLAEDLLGARPDLALVYFQAVDIASHYFWSVAFGPGPEHPEPTTADRERFGDAIHAVYRRQDAWIGRLIEAFGGVGPERAVVVLSDHGFGPAKRRQKRSPHVTGTHRRDGILIAAGGPFAAGRTAEAATVFDVAPTLLHLLGLPAGEDMPGRVWESTFDPAWAKANPPRRVPSWDGAPGAKPALPPADAADRDKIELLRSLGYLD